MPLVFADNAEGIALANFLNKVAPEDKILKLFKNNITPAETDTAATYTEAAFTGYAAKNLAGANWTIVEGAPTTGTYAQQTWTSSAAQTAENQYGYYYVGATSGKISGAERFPAGPYAIANNGDNVQVTPTMTMD